MPMRNSIRLSCGTSVFCHAALDVVGTSHGVDHAGELNESAVPGVLDDTSVMLSDFGIEKRLTLAKRLRWPGHERFCVRAAAIHLQIISSSSRRRHRRSSPWPASARLW